MGKSATMLQEAQLKMVTQTKCQEQFANVKGALINEKVLCAAEHGKDACQVNKSFLIQFSFIRIFNKCIF